MGNEPILIENIKLMSLVAREITDTIKIIINKLNRKYRKSNRILRLELQPIVNSVQKSVSVGVV